jgi:hypothetical protein
VFPGGSARVNDHVAVSRKICQKIQFLDEKLPLTPVAVHQNVVLELIFVKFLAFVFRAQKQRNFLFQNLHVMLEK